MITPVKIVCLLALAVSATTWVTLPSAEAADGKQYRRPLQVQVYKKRYRGGYSLYKSDRIDTRRFTDPTLTRQSQGGPFDNGYFFETPHGAFGGTSPYFQ